MRLDVRDASGQAVDPIEVDDAVFGIEPNGAVVHQTLLAQLAARRAGRFPVSFQKRTCCSGRDRNSISAQASFGCFVDRNMTSEEPPANDTPGPSGPGSGAVAHTCCIESGSRRANSPRFHGPVTIMANVPRSNSWYMFAISWMPSVGARPSWNRLK